MVYTVGEMAKLMNVAPSTLRYYDKEGLLPFVERSRSGIRLFRESDYEWLQIIECLKKSGLSIKDIKRFIYMVMDGDNSLKERLELFAKQREVILSKMHDLQETLDTVNFKCWYYETAVDAGTEEIFKDMTYKDIPEEFRSTGKKLLHLEDNEV